MAVISVFILFSIFIIYTMNRLTNSLCVQKNIPEDRQPKLFRTINILVTILLISSYIEILYTQTEIKPGNAWLSFQRLINPSCSDNNEQNEKHNQKCKSSAICSRHNRVPPLFNHFRLFLLIQPCRTNNDEQDE